MSFKRIALAPIGLLESIDGSKLVFASERGDEEISFDYSPNDFVYFRCRAITADESNGNGDLFPTAELKKAYKSFVGVGLYKDHDSDSVEKSIGKVLWAEWIPDGNYVECYCAVDKQLAPELAHRVRNGIINSVSMGASVQEAECSICGNVAHNVNELCDCMMPGTGVKGRHGNDGKIIFEINRGVQFNELSLVTVPADSTARIFEVYASLNKRAENEDIPDYSEMSLPSLDSYFDGLSVTARDDTHKQAIDLARDIAKKYLYYSNPAFLVTEQMAASVAFSGSKALADLKQANPWSLNYFWEWMVSTHVRPGVFGPLSYPDASRWFSENKNDIMAPFKHLYGGDILDKALADAEKQYPGFDPASVKAKKALIANAREKADEVARKNAPSTFDGDKYSIKLASTGSKEFEKHLAASFASHYHQQDVDSVRAIYGQNLHYMGGIPPDLRDKYGAEISEAFRKPVLERFSGKTKTAIYAKLIQYYTLVDEAYALAYGKKEKKIPQEDKDRIEKELGPRIDALIYDFYKTNVSTTDRGGKNVLDFVCEQGNIFNTVLFGTQEKAESAGFWAPGVITDRASESSDESLDTRFRNFFDKRELTSTRTIVKPGPGQAGEEKQKGEYAHRSERLKKNPPLLQDFISTYNYKLGLDTGLYERSLRENGYAGKIMAPQDRWIQEYISHLKNTYKMSDVKIGSMLEKSEFDTAQYINFMPDVADISRITGPAKPRGKEKKAIEEEQARRDQLVVERREERGQAIKTKEEEEGVKQGESVDRLQAGELARVQSDAKPVIKLYNENVDRLQDAISHVSNSLGANPQWAKVVPQVSGISVPKKIDFSKVAPDLNEISIPSLLPAIDMMSKTKRSLMLLVNQSPEPVYGTIASAGSTDKTKARVSPEGAVIEVGSEVPKIKGFAPKMKGFSQNGYWMAMAYGRFDGDLRSQNYRPANEFKTEITDEERRAHPGKYNEKERFNVEPFKKFRITSQDDAQMADFTNRVSQPLGKAGFPGVAADISSFVESVQRYNDALGVEIPEPKAPTFTEETEAVDGEVAPVEEIAKTFGIPESISPLVGTGCKPEDLSRLIKSADERGVSLNAMEALDKFVPIFVIARNDILNNSYGSVGDLVEAYIDVKGELSGILGHPVTIFDNFVSGSIQLRVADDLVKEASKYKEVLERLYTSVGTMHEGISEEDADKLSDFSNLVRSVDVDISGFSKEQPFLGVAQAIGVDGKHAEEVMAKFYKLTMGFGIPGGGAKEVKDEKGQPVRVKDKHGRDVPLKKPKRGQEQEYLTKTEYDVDDKETPVATRYEALRHVIEDGSAVLSRINTGEQAIEELYRHVAATVKSSRLNLESSIKKIIHQSSSSFDTEYMAKAASSIGSSVAPLKSAIYDAVKGNSDIPSDVKDKFIEIKKSKYEGLLDILSAMPAVDVDNISFAQIEMDQVHDIIDMVDPEDFEYMPDVSKIVANGMESINKIEPYASDIEAAYVELGNLGFAPESGGKHLYFKEDLGIKLPYQKYGDVYVTQKGAPMSWMLRSGIHEGQKEVGIEGNLYHRGFTALKNIYIDLNGVEDIIKEKSAQSSNAFEAFLEEFYRGGEAAEKAVSPIDASKWMNFDGPGGLPEDMAEAMKFFDNIGRFLESDEAKAYAATLNKIYSDATKAIESCEKDKDSLDEVINKLSGIDIPEPPTANIPDNDKSKIDMFYAMVFNLLVFGDIFDGQEFLRNKEVEYGLGDSAKGKRNSMYFGMVYYKTDAVYQQESKKEIGGGLSGVINNAVLRDLSRIPLSIETVPGYVDAFIAGIAEINEKIIGSIPGLALGTVPKEEEVDNKDLVWFIADDVRGAKNRIFNLYKMAIEVEHDKNRIPTNPDAVVSALDRIIDGITRLSEFIPVGFNESDDAIRYVLNIRDSVAAGGPIPLESEFMGKVPQAETSEAPVIEPQTVKKAPLSIDEINKEIGMILGHIWTEEYTPDKERVKLPAGVSLEEAIGDPDKRNSVAVSFVSENWPAVIEGLGEIDYDALGSKDSVMSAMKRHAHEVALSLLEGTLDAVSESGLDELDLTPADQEIADIEELKDIVKTLISRDWERKLLEDPVEKMFYSVPVVDMMNNEKARDWFIDKYTFNVFEELFKEGNLGRRISYAKMGGLQRVRVEMKKWVDALVTEQVWKYLSSVDSESALYHKQLEDYNSWLKSQEKVVPDESPAPAEEQKPQYRSWPPMSEEESKAYEGGLEEDRKKFRGTPSWNPPMNAIIGE